MPGKRQKREPVFPIVEVFGFAADADSNASRQAQAMRWCPFMDTECEKFRQYGYGYCSVTYAARADKGDRYTYAVCDHRLDGVPINAAIEDYFGPNPVGVELVPEVVLTNPRRSFDYTAIRVVNNSIVDAIVIESQAIDLRGGGVGTAWRAWQDGQPHRWREYYTEEASSLGRKDTVAYGVNMGNIYKRLGLQVATKGEFLKRCGVRLYVVMQDRPFNYLFERIPFAEAEPGETPDITFITFDYTGEQSQDGMLNLGFVRKRRTTHARFVEALNSIVDEDDRDKFLEQVRRKAKLP